MTLFLILLGLAMAWVIVAILLIATQRVIPPSQVDDDGPFDFDPDSERYQEPTQPLQQYKAPDGTELGYRHYSCQQDDAPLLIFIHGSTNYGGLYEPLAKMIAASGAADVVLPDMRGHGPKLHDRGIAHYVGQLEDDIATLIQQVKKEGQKLIIGGHSLGGGFAIRFASGKHSRKVDEAFLLAPYLNTRAPTNRPNAGGFVRVLYRRALGLAMLGVPKLFGLFRLPVVQFNFSQAYRRFDRSWLSTDQYNFAMTMGFGPRQQWAADVKKLPPFLMVIGEQDEVFFADQYQNCMSALTDKGLYQVLPGVNHIDASMDPATVAAFKQFVGRRQAD